MNNTMWIHAIGLAAAYLGWATLALSQEKHRLTVTVPMVARVKQIRLLGAGLLLLSMVASWVTEGASFGSLLGVIQLSLAAMMVALTLAWKPAWLRWWARRLS